MLKTEVDLARVFRLEADGSDAYLGESPPYPRGRIYGGLVIAQALWAATQTVPLAHSAHSLHAYFILGGDLAQPVRYEVERVRDGRSFTTRHVTARQSSGAILTLTCSFQVDEPGPETQSLQVPEDLAGPEELEPMFDYGALRCNVPLLTGPSHPPRSAAWCRYPIDLGTDFRLHACALAYLSDINPMTAVGASHPDGPIQRADWGKRYISATLGHAMWFHRPSRSDEWVLLDMTGHGLIGSRGLATGSVFSTEGVHVATIAQEGLIRTRRGS